MNEATTRDIDIALMRAFLAVVETGSVTKAANRLNLTQAAVSLQIKRLETLFDKKFFERDGRSIKLTSLGERMHPFALKMIRLNDDVWNTIVAPEFEGQLKLGVPHDIVGTFMPTILRDFHRRWPKIRVSLTCNTTPELLSALDAGTIDMTLTTESEPREDLLLADSLVWVGAVGGQAHLQSPLPVSLGGEKCAFRGAAVKALANAGRDWNIISQFGSMEPAIAAVEADLAVAPFILQTVPQQLSVLSDASELPGLPVFFINLVLPETETTPIAKALASAIREGFADRMKSAA